MSWVSIAITSISCLIVGAIFIKNHILGVKTKISDVVSGALAFPIALVVLLLLSLAATGTTSFEIFWGIIK